MKHLLFLICLCIITGSSFAQISPGELANAHSHLEGMSNCTKCHSLGAKISNEKCLACHTELKSRIDQKKGYHASAEIRGKGCITCHSDHHGKNFQLVRFVKEKFDHNLSGFKLSGAHAKKQCNECHKPAFIATPAIRTKKFTYLGLKPECISCHPDYHQKNLRQTCSDCHDFEAFKPASLFSHVNTKFQLTGKHRNVPCASCHKVSVLNGKKFQQFAGVKFQSCANCHTDPHHNQFGPNCSDCHTGETFHAVKTTGNFDHSKTGFPLENKHKTVACKSCHKTNMTDPVKHAKCTDCHADYHYGQFTTANAISNCSDCHSTKGFAGSSYTIERHNLSRFPLNGAHLATPCIFCHKKQEKWSFREIGLKCVDCHENVHFGLIEQKYYPGNSCESCHNNESWNKISFDHQKTAFALEGPHANQTCKACHFRKDSSGKEVQKFADMSSACTSCHTDNHYGQFENNGVTRCLRCHASNTWKIVKFDHNKTAFKLDGQHEKVACAKCHKAITRNQKTFVLYKTNKLKCENCH